MDNNNENKQNEENVKEENAKTEKKKGGKSKKVIIIAVIVFFVLLIMSTIITVLGINKGWFGNKKDDENNSGSNEVSTHDENSNELNITIEDKDLYASGGGYGLVVIENGKVYRLSANQVGNSMDYQTSFEEVSSIKNATTVSVHNFGTGVNPISLVTTEDGTLYEIGYGDEKRILEDYKVEYVTDAGGEMDYFYELVLKDGRKIKITEPEMNSGTTKVEEIAKYSKVNITGNKGNKQSGTDLVCNGVLNDAAFIVNGNVYEVQVEKQHSDVIFKIEKIDQLSDVKGIKCYALGTGMDSSFFAITNSGKVYNFANKTVNNVAYMDGYEVEDITDVKKIGSDEHGFPVHEFTLKLKDGTRATVKNGTAAENSTNQEELSSAELTNLENYLNTREGNGFVAHNLYESIDKIDLGMVFYNTSECDSQEEINEYLNGGEQVTGVFKVTMSDAKDVYYKNTGKYLSNDEVRKLFKWEYLGKYDAFYTMHGDTSYSKVTCQSGYKTADGLFKVVLTGAESYEDSNDGSNTTKRVKSTLLTVKKDGDAYKFVSHVANEYE